MDLHGNGEALGECFRNICTRPGGNPKGIWSKRSAAFCISGHRVIAGVFSGSYLLMVKSTSKEFEGQEPFLRMKVVLEGYFVI